MIDQFLHVAPLRETYPAAFRRMGLVTLVYVYRLVAGLLLAAPLVAVGSSAVSGQPRGDAVLWDPGAIMLLEVLRIGGRSAPALGLPSLAALILVMLVGLLMFAALVAGLGRRGPLPAGYLAARASAKIGTLAILWGVGHLAEVIFGGLVFLLGAKIIAALNLDPRTEDTARFALTAVVLFAAAVVGVIRDFAMVTTVNDDARFYTACQRAIRAAGGAPLRIAAAYAARAVPMAATIGFGAWIVGRGSYAGEAIPFLIHQLVIAIAVFLHASWLAAALRLVERYAPRDAA
jgi:hypothetical protein